MAAIPPGFDSRLPHVSDSGLDPTGGTMPSSSHHGGSAGHLPPVQQKLDLVGELELSDEFGDVLPGQIADVAVHKGFAYLNSWDDPTASAAARSSWTSATRASPSRSPSSRRSSPTTTARAPTWSRSTRRSSRATCWPSTTRPTARTSSLNARRSTRPTAASTSTTCRTRRTRSRSCAASAISHPTTARRRPVDPEEGAGNSYHSVFVWQDGSRPTWSASTTSSSTTSTSTTSPTRPHPEFIAEYDLFEGSRQIIEGRAGSATGTSTSTTWWSSGSAGGDAARDYWDSGLRAAGRRPTPSARRYITDTSSRAPTL